jgi:hypothetical protein
MGLKTAGEVMLTAILLMCTGQLGTKPDLGPPDKFETMIAVPAEGRGFIVFEGKFLRLTKIGASIYKFAQAQDHRRLSGAYDFPSGGLLVNQDFENTVEPDKPGLHTTIKAFCKNPGQ